MTTQTKKWLRISLIVGLLIGLLCCLVIGSYLLFVRVMSNVPKANDPWVRSLAWSPDDSQLAVGSADHTITIWDVKSAKLLLTITKHSASVRELDWSPDGTMLASGAGDGSIYLWDPLTGNLVYQLATENEQDALGFLAWSTDGSRLAYAGDTGNIMLWDAASQQKTMLVKSSGLKSLNNIITGMSWSPDDTQLATSSADGTVSIWDVQTGQSIWVVTAHKGWANDVEWSPDGALLASGGDDGLLKVWDAEAGKLVNQTNGSDSIFSVGWSPKTKSQIAWMSARGQVAITDFQQPDIHLNAGDAKVWVVAWSRDGQQLAAGTDVNTVFIWDAVTGQQIQFLTLPTP